MSEETNTGRISDSVDNSLELTKHATSVHSQNIQKDITSDFIYAKLPEELINGIIEVGNHAYYIKRLYKHMTKEIKMHDWNKETQEWETRNPNAKEEKTLEIMETRVFDSFMTKLKLISILHRNKPSNPILGFIKPEKEENEEAENNIMEKIGNYMKNKGETSQ